MAESFGESMAPSLNLSRTIMPYSRAQVFTKGWKQDFQAHHIYEQDWMDLLGHSKDEIANAPAIILTKKEHEAITKELAFAKDKLMDEVQKKRGKGALPDKAELWGMYKKVYEDNPTWLEAIKGYFQT
jgi:hypothetical protein